jgi:hypothetical protein
MRVKYEPSLERKTTPPPPPVSINEPSTIAVAPHLTHSMKAVSHSLSQGKNCKSDEFDELGTIEMSRYRWRSRGVSERNLMKNIAFGALSVLAVAAVMSCSWKLGENRNSAGTDIVNSANNSTGSRTTGKSTSVKKAYRISGTIDDASQEGNVCDTSIKFKVPGTLEFEFTPTDATKGNYTYSGPFNATGSGPYVINDDGTMLVDGTGCIMGKCATYSHTWKAEPINAATCK